MIAHRSISLCLLCIILSATEIPVAAVPGTPDFNFVATSCGATLYPPICVRSLSPYAARIGRSPRRLIKTAVAVSLSRARSTSSFVEEVAGSRGMRARDSAAVRDCLEQVSDGVDMMSKSLEEMKALGRPESPEFQWHLNNVQTWLSAALTDETTCLDGFTRAGRVKSEVQTRITYLAKLTSNALALFNNLAGKS